MSEVMNVGVMNVGQSKKCGNSQESGRSNQKQPKMLLLGPRIWHQILWGCPRLNTWAPSQKNLI